MESLVVQQDIEDRLVDLRLVRPAFFEVLHRYPAKEGLA